jgi:hypothetical protein
MKRVIFLILLVSLLLTTHHLQAQKIESALKVMATQHAAEKLYIHYDKEYYVAGETIWLKAYLYSDGKPSSISSNFYLQLTDSKGKLIASKKYPIMGAVAKGNIDLPDTLAQGNYYIRAFTPYMLNNDEALVYKKNIYIFNPIAVPVRETIPVPVVSLQFFPESGHMVDGMLTVVAFKASDQFGNPVTVNGLIKTEEGTTIVPFKTYHDGIGRIQFKPQSGKKYSAEVELKTGPRSYPLPDVVPAGINLKIQDEKGGKLFQLARSEKDKEKYDVLNLIVHMNNRIVYENEIAFEDYPSVKGHLVTDSLPSGILHFTVFDKEGMPLAERLAFVNNREYMSESAIEVTKLGAGKREENIFELSFPDIMQRSASVSIIAAQPGSFNRSDNIYSRFLLTGDLKGYVHDPGYYFSKQSDSVQLALDNLMLTHGWSRFTWKKILAGEFPQKNITDGHLLNISGIVREANGADKNPVSGGRLNIYTEAEDSTTQNYDIPVDAQGRFVMDSMIFLGKTKMYYVYSNSQGKTRPGFVFLDQSPLKNVVEMIPERISANTGTIDPATLQNNEEIAQRSRYVKTRLDEVKMLERVTVRATTHKKPIDVVNEKYTSGVFRTMGKENLDNINEPGNDRSMNALDYIKNRIQQLQIQNGRLVNRKNFSLMTGQNWAVQVFLDESPVDLSILRVLRVDQLALVKFYEAGFVGVGSGAPGGALAVYTKESTAEEPKIEKLDYVEYNGYSVTKEFYSPDYNSPDRKPDLTDNRTTLYWNPDIYTDMETKKITLKFFNNDISKQFKVIAEGFDASGKLIRVEKIIGE